MPFFRASRIYRQIYSAHTARYSGLSAPPPTREELVFIHAGGDQGVIIMTRSLPAAARAAAKRGITYLKARDVSKRVRAVSPGTSSAAYISREKSQLSTEVRPTVYPRPSGPK